MENCLFCKIVAGKIPSHKIWEDETHLAFLTIFPNTEGFTVVVPKKHYPSYVFDLPDDVMSKLMIATKKVAKLLDVKLEDVGRTALIFEGFEIDHVHAKLFPMHGTKNKDWKPVLSDDNLKYFEKYEGYVSSHNGKRVDDKVLDTLAKKLRESSGFPLSRE